MIWKTEGLNLFVEANGARNQPFHGAGHSHIFANACKKFLRYFCSYIFLLRLYNTDRNALYNVYSSDTRRVSVLPHSFLCVWEWNAWSITQSQWLLFNVSIHKLSKVVCHYYCDPWCGLSKLLCKGLKECLTAYVQLKDKVDLKGHSRKTFSGCVYPNLFSMILSVSAWTAGVTVRAFSWNFAVWFVQANAL